MKTVHFKIFATKCSFCDSVFTTKASARDHELRIHKDPDGTQKKYACELCDFKGHFKNQIKQHMIVHSNSSIRFPCDVCLKEFKAKTYLKIHSKVHLPRTKHSCDICAKEFFNK